MIVRRKLAGTALGGGKGGRRIGDRWRVAVSGTGVWYEWCDRRGRW